MRTQWCVRVRKRDAELYRQDLVRRGLLDLALKPRKEGEWVLFPVSSPFAGATREEFEAHPGQGELPRHELIGGIAVMQERDPQGAARLLASRPSLHTVLVPESDVEGPWRTRRFEVLAGEPTTRTRYLEHGMRFEIDLAEAYFSARLSTERQRLLAAMDKGERVLDMFAGVGPCALTLARKAAFVAASDLNPGAVRLMERNIALNRARNVLPLLIDASHLPSVLPWRFDRVVMNLPLGAIRFLPAAIVLCRPGGVIHCYALQEKEGEFLGEIETYPVASVRERFVRSYSPGRWHAVYDIALRRAH
ncbi:MAG: tRNA (guanine(37)-N1)-methyltransferase Trm5b [Methanoregulaceae archaeon PtaB.Bin056]|jgi:tRNA (guanine37-N1)-methyltransferase|nr:MAG: tRNA (guanine(37)-N1)-methyltransferase Trm5b [Methanoregulaceae archaeon PtaB.Bin056]